MDPNSFRLFMVSSAGAGGGLPSIGDSYRGGYYAGAISHTANGIATHALVVAPRNPGASGTGYPTGTTYKWANSATYTNATSLFNGKQNMDTLVGLGISNFPAANFCYGLSIDGYTDWYLPSPYELAIAYYYLKPGTGGNNTAYGANDFAVPVRTSNYTASDPPQTSVSIFKAGGSEAFVQSNHLSSFESGLSTIQRIDFGYGGVGSTFKTSAGIIRAFRQVPL